MIDIKELTNDEIAEWCEIVSHQFIKEYFKRNSKSYNKLIKTVSTPVAKLINPEIEKIVQSNKSNKFISEVYNDLTEPILKEIKEEISKSVEGGTDEIWATCEALLNSCFHGKFDLYFKLTETDSDVTNATLVKNISNLMKQVDGISVLENKNRELESQKAASDKKIEGLSSQISDQKAEISKLKAKLEKETNDKELAENSVSDWIARVEDAQKVIDELKLEREELVITENVTKYNKNWDYEYTSICRADYNTYQDDKMLYRLADIDESGEIKPFVPNYGQRIFDNRDWLFITDNKDIDEGIVAIWDWRADKRNNDPSKDFITTSLKDNIKPIIKIKDVFQTETLISSLRKGISVPKGNLRFMFVIWQGNDHFGIVIPEKSYIISNDILKINSDVVCVPKYKISLSLDFIQIDGSEYYHCLDLSSTVGYEPVKDPIEFVKETVIEYANGNVLNKFNLVRKERSRAKDFIKDLINALPTNSILDEIKSKYGCSLKKAKEYLEKFSNCANKYFEGSSEENQALLNAINSSPELYKKCEETVRTDWERQNSEMIDKSNEELNRIQNEAKTKQSDLQHFEEKLAEKEKLAEEVNKRVAEKIQSAQSNAAEFISTMAFMNPLRGESANSGNNSTIVRMGENVNNVKFEDVNSFDEWLGVCYENFDRVGISNYDSSDSLAAFMYTAYIKKIPLILSGPCARRIADAFSYSIFGKTAAYVNCSGDFSNGTYDEIMQLPDEIVVIDNAFSTTWVNYIMNLINNPAKFYILVQPFSEDLLIEPKGILNYTVPVLTELLVENIPDQINYTAPIFGEEFKFMEISNDVRYNNRYFRKLSLCTIVKNRFKILLGNVNIMIDENITSDLILGIIPLAYITGNIELIKDALDTEVFAPSTEETLKSFLGVENDDTITNS